MDDLPVFVLEHVLAQLPPEKQGLAGGEIILAMIETWEVMTAALIGGGVLDERFRDALLSRAKIQREFGKDIRAAIVERLADAIPGMAAAARAERMPTRGRA